MKSPKQISKLKYQSNFKVQFEIPQSKSLLQKPHVCIRNYIQLHVTEPQQTGASPYCSAFFRNRSRLEVSSPDLIRTARMISKIQAPPVFPQNIPTHESHQMPVTPRRLLQNPVQVLDNTKERTKDKRCLRNDCSFSNNPIYSNTFHLKSH